MSQRDKAIEICQPQFEEGETVVAAFANAILKSGSLTAAHLAGQVAGGVAGASLGKAVAAKNIPFVVTDRRIFFLGTDVLKHPKEVADVVPRKDVSVRSSNFGFLILPHRLALSVRGQDIRFDIGWWQKGDVRALVDAVPS